MILRMSFEEVATMNAAVERLLGEPGEGAVLAPPEVLAELESRIPLRGDLSILTLAEQGRLLGAVDMVLDYLKRRMDAVVLEQYVGAEDAVNAYFDYANVLTTRTRLDGLGVEMSAMIEVITGQAPTPADREAIGFPD
ncbi:MAG: hypothetical protein P8177_08290 [Gemmatimonadota bacterium]|jgi:hypothetical protein